MPVGGKAIGRLSGISMINLEKAVRQIAAWLGLAGNNPKPSLDCGTGRTI
jgi:hypothetical protein